LVVPAETVDATLASGIGGPGGWPRLNSEKRFWVAHPCWVCKGGVFLLLFSNSQFLFSSWSLLGRVLTATYLGTWIVLLVLFLYGPILIAQMSDPSTAAKVEGINYFADTLLFAGAILALASATPRTLYLS
jgi:hypothetical protein